MPIVQLTPDIMHHPTRRQFLQTGSVLLGSAIAADFSNAADPYADAKFIDGPPPPLADGAFTMVLLPDTQNYRGPHAAGFAAQTQWIIDQKTSRNIVGVLHLGDITNDNLPEQWENAAKSMKLLDGKVPYCMAPGNHDYSKGGSAVDRTSLFGEYFPPADWKKQPAFGGFYDKEPERVENSYHFLSAGERKFLILCLEFGPRKDVVRWANEIVAKHPKLEVILVTHAYMYSDSTRYDHVTLGKKQNWNPHTYGVAKASNGDVSDGQELWDHLVSKHPNFILTLNGHVLNDGLGRLASQGAKTQDVHQFLVNFQMKPKGGDGWLRLLEFRADRTVQVYDYSPTRNQVNASEENQFSLKLGALPPG